MNAVTYFAKTLLNIFQISNQQLEFVAYAPNGFEQPSVGDALQLLTQTLDVNVHRTRVSEVIKSPHLVQKLIARKYAVGM
jgi:hypothetical protein